MAEIIKNIDTDEMINRLDEIALEKVELEEAILGTTKFVVQKLITKELI